MFREREVLKGREMLSALEKALWRRRAEHARCALAAELLPVEAQAIVAGKEPLGQWQRAAAAAGANHARLRRGTF